MIAPASLLLRLVVLSPLFIGLLQHHAGHSIAAAATASSAVARRFLHAHDGGDDDALQNGTSVRSDAEVLRAIWLEAGSPAALSDWAGGSGSVPALADNCLTLSTARVAQGVMTWRDPRMYHCSEDGKYVTALCLYGPALGEARQPGLLKRLAPLLAQLRSLKRLTVKHFDVAPGNSVADLATLTTISTLAALEVHDNNMLTGQLPPQWSVMTSLTNMHMPRNAIEGTLPPQWSTLTNLAWLYTMSCKVSGPLPAQYSVLQSLDTLFVPMNAHTGTLPAEWSALTRLTWLSVRENKLVGTLPEQWSTLRNLDTLSVSVNKLTGTLPAAYSTLSNSHTPVGGMWFHHNLFTGTLPAQYSTMTKLMLMDVKSCRFTGTLPVAWSALTALTELDAGDQYLSGTLPTAWSTLGALSRLELDVNGFDGTLPAEWGETMTHVTRLALAGNPDLTGAIPASWSAVCEKAAVTYDRGDC